MEDHTYGMVASEVLSIDDLEALSHHHLPAVSIMADPEDEVNIAQFHPFPGRSHPDSLLIMVTWVVVSLYLCISFLYHPLTHPLSHSLTSIPSPFPLPSYSSLLHVSNISPYTRDGYCVWHQTGQSQSISQRLLSSYTQNNHILTDTSLAVALVAFPALFVSLNRTPIGQPTVGQSYGVAMGERNSPKYYRNDRS